MLRKLEKAIKEELVKGFTDPVTKEHTPLIDVELVRKDRDNDKSRCARISRRGVACSGSIIPLARLAAAPGTAT